MRTFRYLFLASTLSAATGLVSIESAAQPSDDDAQSEPATADVIQRGIAMRRAGRDEAALGLFLEAERQSPSSVRVLLHVTAAAQATGRWLMAHQYLQKAAAFRSDPYYQRYRGAIRAMEDTVAQHVGQFRVLGSPDGAEVLLNGEPVATLPMASAKVVEVGSYVLEVRKAGYYSLKRPIHVAAGGSLAQEAVELKQQEASGSGLREPGGAFDQGNGDANAAVRAPQTGLKSRWITWTLAGTGVALAATSGAAFFVREQEADHWNDDSRCLQGTRTRQEVCGNVRDRVNSAEDIGIVTGILAAGFGGAALVHWIWTADSPPTTREAAGIRATCDAGLGGIFCHGTF